MKYILLKYNKHKNIVDRQWSTRRGEQVT